MKWMFRAAVINANRNHSGAGGNETMISLIFVLAGIVLLAIVVEEFMRRRKK